MPSTIRNYYQTQINGLWVESDPINGQMCRYVTELNGSIIGYAEFLYQAPVEQI